MTGLDTNILVRYLTQDDEVQFLAVLGLLNRKGATFFVTDIVLVETDWVLASLYDWTPDEVVESFARLLTIRNLVFEDEHRLRGALHAMRQGADLSDELIVALCKAKGCKDLATFDKGMRKRHGKFAFSPK